ncbi:hypothetical protein L1987_03768 [Smallanthus sonchifolius]|uniref:Uncharacterized protein n=1 Tax=Smallanthus sonchifolius TaxID=185202 RepID=A0ACB9KBI3_9ASTR|nr:hypothetical protein L1987_03768 [Smallanthus sonchifolius]
MLCLPIIILLAAAFPLLIGQAACGCPASLKPGRWLDLYSGIGSVGNLAYRLLIEMLRGAFRGDGTMGCF